MSISLLQYITLQSSKSCCVDIYHPVTLSPYHPVKLLSLTANNRRDHPFIYSLRIIRLSVSVHLQQSCPGARLSYSQLTSRTRSHNLQISIWERVLRVLAQTHRKLFDLLAPLNFKAIKFSILNVNTSNETSFVEL